MVLAVVGSRQPNAAQQQRCREGVAAALAAGWEIVTGGAPGIDSVAVHAAQTAGHADRVTLVLPWERFGGWQDLRLKRIVFDPEGCPEHRDWLSQLGELRPSARNTMKPGAVRCLARDVGIVRMADSVFAFTRVDEPQRGGTAFAVRVARDLGKNLWIDDGTRPVGTPFRAALRRIPAQAPA